ncbi:MAG: hypothetical protein AB1498_03880 [bacterium]
MKKRKLLLTFLVAIFFAGCSLSNPLSELSWGTATVVGRVTRSTTSLGGTVFEGVPGAYIKTDSGTEQTRTNEEGYYSLTLRFRTGSAAKEKKIKILAFDYINAGKTGSVGDITIRDGIITEAPPISWAK